AGLLALASVLGVGEGHLLHRETRWVGSRYFAKSESLFQSFPRCMRGLTSPTVGASLLAKNLNDNACFLNERGAYEFFASKLAPTKALTDWH
ncbi:hypothetical protein KEM07_27275, partial [Pseudomonas carnis]|nr:hypothetical protein [Pseudomonas carnis]MBV2089070.1 hypothetical protein [Pseudomonas carnis]MDO3693189.1 hypothetical protein [Pseudomonas sp. DKN 2791]MDO7035259.1 hypothetical protein [Pseudomonas sp. DKN 2792]